MPRSFDFDGNDKWKQYRASLEIPAGKSVDEVLLKFKAKWYRREIVSSRTKSSVSAERHPHCTTGATNIPAHPNLCLGAGP